MEIGSFDELCNHVGGQNVVTELDRNVWKETRSFVTTIGCEGSGVFFGTWENNYSMFEMKLLE